MRNEVITFKVDAQLLEAMKGLPNRSDFIRNALLTALNSTCPVCKGSGVLTPNQQKHWSSFLEAHSFTECDDCHEVHLICNHDDEPDTPA